MNTVTIIPDGLRNNHLDPGPDVRFPPRLPEQTAASVRATQAPLELDSQATWPVRVDPASVGIGDRFGSRVIVAMTHGHVRRHGYPCHCVWHGHTRPGCSYDDPGCPCYGFDTVYHVICRCDCGTVRPVSMSSLITGSSLSCGRCYHNRYGERNAA